MWRIAFLFLGENDSMKSLAKVGSISCILDYNHRTANDIFKNWVSEMFFEICAIEVWRKVNQCKANAGKPV